MGTEFMLSLQFIVYHNIDNYDHNDVHVSRVFVYVQ